MRRESFKLAGAVAAVLMVAACNDNPMAPISVVPQAARGGGSTSAPKLTVFVGGSVTYREAGPSNTGSGVCLSGGRWQNTAGGYTTVAAHPNCAIVTGGQSSVVNLAVTAGKQGKSTILQGPNGWLWYQPGPDATVGSGSFSANDGSWQVIATQPLLNDRGNFLNAAGMVVIACSSTGCEPGLLAW